MIRKCAAVIAFGAGAYFGYRLTFEIFDYYASDFSGYWGETAGQIVRVVLPVAVGAVAAIVVYFLLNFFARED
jgi:hypothetical protein